MLSSAAAGLLVQATFLISIVHSGYSDGFSHSGMIQPRWIKLTCRRPRAWMHILEGVYCMSTTNLEVRKYIEIRWGSQAQCPRMDVQQSHRRTRSLLMGRDAGLGSLGVATIPLAHSRSLMPCNLGRARATWHDFPSCFRSWTPPLPASKPVDRGTPPPTYQRLIWHDSRSPLSEVVEILLGSDSAPSSPRLARHPRAAAGMQPTEIRFVHDTEWNEHQRLDQHSTCLQSSMRSRGHLPQAGRVADAG